MSNAGRDQNHNALYLATAGGVLSAATAANAEVVYQQFNVDIPHGAGDHMLDLNTMTLTDRSAPGGEEAYENGGDWDVYFEAAEFIPAINGDPARASDSTRVAAPGSAFEDIAPGGTVYCDPYGGPCAFYDENSPEPCPFVVTTCPDNCGCPEDTLGVIVNPNDPGKAFGDNDAVFGDYFVENIQGHFYPCGTQFDDSAPVSTARTPTQTGRRYLPPIDPMRELPPTGEYLIPVQVGTGHGWVRYEITNWTQVEGVGGFFGNLSVHILKDIRIVDAAFNPNGGIILGQVAPTPSCNADINADNMTDGTDLSEFLAGLSSASLDSCERGATDIARPIDLAAPSDAFDLFEYLSRADACVNE